MAGTGGSATGGAAGFSGGSGGSGGGAGTGGITAGASGSSGSAGEASGAAGSSAGSGGAAGAPTCGEGLTPNVDVVRACVLAAGCDPFKPSQRIGDCIASSYPTSRIDWSCLAKVQTCSDVEMCTNKRYVQHAGCKKGDEVCIGNAAALCVSSTQAAVYEDCSMVGGQCGTYTDQTGAKLADCKVKDACTETDAFSHCDAASNALYTCIGGVGYGLVCSTIQANCAGSGADASCYYNYPKCAGGGSDAYSCDGSSLVLCTAQNQSIRYDCGSGTACGGIGQAVDCLAPGCAYSESAACVESCDGLTAKLCVGGATLPVDCSKYGFTSCTLEKIGANKTVSAAVCLPLPMREIRLLHHPSMSVQSSTSCNSGQATVGWSGRQLT